MIFLWRYIIGYIIVEISGENCEQILNYAAANNINFWNLKYKKGTIYGNISPRNFLKLFTIRHGVKCKIKIIKKSGLCFQIKKYKKRFGFLIGVIVFAMILIFLSNYVWIINVEGNNIISTQEIINSCKKLGIYEGINKNKINNKYDAQRLLLIQDGIAWCSMNTEGSVLTVNLSETRISDEKEREDPSNIKAAIDGKIKKIDIASGNVVVKVGDTVSKGDILVSGIVENMSSTLFVHSDGEIIAETKRVFSAQGDFIQEVTSETGDNITHYSIDFFNIKIPLYLDKISQKYNYTCNIKNLTLFDKNIPIKIAREQYKLTQNTTIEYDKITLENILNDNIKKQLDDFKFISAIKIDEEIISNDKGILLNITYLCEENIGVQSKILLGKEN